MPVTKTTKLVLCAFFAALTAILSQIVIPIGPVPINLATFAVFCAGAMLGSGLGAVSMLVWALLGAVGIPVFTMLRGGLNVLVGPTGGYIIGYIPAAFLVGLIVERFGVKNRLFTYFPAMLAGMATYFLFGTVWYSHMAGVGFSQAFPVCVLPFIPGDLLKITAAALISHRLRPRIHLHPRQSQAN